MRAFSLRKTKSWFFVCCLLTTHLTTWHLNIKQYKIHSRFHVFFSFVFSEKWFHVFFEHFFPGLLLYLFTYPSANVASPSNNTRFKPGMRTDTCSFQNRASLDTNAVFYNYIWSYGYIRTNSAICTDFCAGILKSKSNIKDQ